MRIKPFAFISETTHAWMFFSEMHLFLVDKNE